MWNYAPLASGLHRLPSKFSLAASLHLSSLEKLHEVSVSKADRSHVFLYWYSLQALRQFGVPFLLTGIRSTPSSWAFNFEISSFLSLFVLSSTFSFHHTTIITHTHTLSTASLFIQSLKLWEKGSPEVTEALWFQSGMENLNKKKLFKSA